METESLSFDIVIVGAGPAGLSAAIRLGQLNANRVTPLSIAVLEKGATIGAHLLSGAVLETAALAELLPDFKERSAPLDTAVTADNFYYLTQHHAFRLPLPHLMQNTHHHLIQLGVLARWLAQEAEALGIAIFPGFAASELLYDDHRVIGVKTNDVGRDKNGQPTAAFQPGIPINCRQLLLAEGCRGHLTEQVIQRYQLRSTTAPQTYGLGIKELWEVDSPDYHTGQVTHTVGWPLDRATYGGSFIYHLQHNKVALGLVIGLDYTNPYLDPFAELQRFKTHPQIKPLLQGGRCIGYGARALNEGGWQAIPRLSFPGGLLLGCAAGFVNVAKIKGIHNAIRSGIIAAELLTQTADSQLDAELSHFTATIQQSSIGRELYRVRNLRPGFHRGLLKGLCYAALDQYLLRGHAPWTWRYQADYTQLQPARRCHRITYSKPDGYLTFDKLSLLPLTGVAYREDQPCHLHLKDPALALTINQNIYGSPEQYYCPAGVYEIITINGQTRLQINSSQCIQCKSCDIKDPRQNIQWLAPEGGAGPNYQEM